MKLKITYSWILVRLILIGGGVLGNVKELAKTDAMALGKLIMLSPYYFVLSFMIKV